MPLLIDNKPLLKIGELIWVVGYDTNWGWALYLGEGFEYLHRDDGALIKYLAYFEGKTVALERGQFRRFFWYNKHLLE